MITFKLENMSAAIYFCTAKRHQCVLQFVHGVGHQGHLAMSVTYNWSALSNDISVAMPKFHYLEKGPNVCDIDNDMYMLG